MGQLPSNNRILLQYTTINHVARVRLGLTNNEYCLADSYYQLSKNEPYTEVGCVESDTELARHIGVSRRTILSLKKKLLENGLIIKTSAGGFKTTQLWYETVVLGVQILHSEAERCEETAQGCEDSSHNNNIYINNISSSDNKLSSEELDSSSGTPGKRKKRKGTRPSIPYQWRQNIIDKVKEVTGKAFLDKSDARNRLAAYNLIFDFVKPGESPDVGYERALDFIQTHLAASNFYRDKVRSVVMLRENKQAIYDDAQLSQKGGSTYGKG